MPPLRAQSAQPPEGLQQIVVTATRVATSAFELPAAISSVPAARLREDALGVNLADDIALVPGLLARNRYNYAQDQQISIRGIGSNSTFGIRGVRIYQDGIPATGADGQGQVSQINLDSAERVEVLRGPFSALYGNSAGGVVQVFTARGAAPGELASGVDYGSFGTWRAGLRGGDAVGPVRFAGAFTHFATDGFRPHSAARNESFNGRLDLEPASGQHLELIANVVSRPDAQDPLGLTPPQFAAAAHQTSPVALAFDTRKSFDQEHGGAIYELQLGATQTVRLMGYYGHRAVTQFLAIPKAAQASPRSAGGVVDLDRDFGGADARWTWAGELARRLLTFVAGLSYDTQDELRRGYDNYRGSRFGVAGALRRDENDITRDLDEYAEGTWRFATDWSLTAGLRHSEVRFRVDDHYIRPGNGDDSGSMLFTATSPVGALMYDLRPWLHLYAAYGQGFQTPLGSELAYRPDGSSGLNTALKPAVSNNTEAGLKLQAGSTLYFESALFQTRTRDEIVIARNLGGRSSYQNAGRTRRQGVEAFGTWTPMGGVQAQLAWTYVDAYYADAYLTCVAAPCPQPNVRVGSGNRLPGVPRNDVYAALRVGGDTGWRLTVSAQALAAVAADDSNSVTAPGYVICGLAAGYTLQPGWGRVSAFVRINNLFDRRYVGSVIVDDGNQRYFEPGPGTAVLGGVQVAFR